MKGDFETPSGSTNLPTIQLWIELTSRFARPTTPHADSKNCLNRSMKSESADASLNYVLDQVPECGANRVASASSVTNPFFLEPGHDTTAEYTAMSSSWSLFRDKDADLSRN